MSAALCRIAFVATVVGLVARGVAGQAVADPESLVDSAIGAPPHGQLWLGAWLDMQQGYEDTPSAFNQRFGRNAGVFQLSQDIPVTPYNYNTGAGGIANVSSILNSKTDAGIFLTVYPMKGITNQTIADQDLIDLGNQLLGWTNTIANTTANPHAKRRVYLRWAPEMNGNWNPAWSPMPLQYVDQWKRMYNIVKNITGDSVAIVWAPNASPGYPYGIGMPAIQAVVNASTDAYSAQQEFAALDTNHDGQLDTADDAYLPFWPGQEYVDWCAISYYYKGTASPFLDNTLSNPGDVWGALIGVNFPTLANAAQPTTQFTDLYNNYCVQYGKPCAFSESGSAWHVNDPPGPGQLALQTAWIQNGIANSSFLDYYPLFKMFMMFEFEKVEDPNDLRDYRLTNNSAVLQSFLYSLDPVATRYAWASPAEPTNLPTNADGSTPSTPTSSVPTGPTPPSLFGGSLPRWTASLPVALVASALVVGVTLGAELVAR